MNAVACRSIQKGDDPKGFNTAVSAMIRHGATNGGCYSFVLDIYIYIHMLYLMVVIDCCVSVERREALCGCLLNSYFVCVGGGVILDSLYIISRFF